MEPTWQVPREGKPAPGELLLVQGFVNTREAERGLDVLLDPAVAAGWLSRAGLWAGPGAPGLYELDFARKLREGLRLLLVSHNGGPAPASGPLQPLHDLAAAATVSVEVGPDGRMSLQATRDGRLDLQLARLLLVIRDAQLVGTWPRLKACHDPGCQWAFYDRSHSQQGIWCDMQVCGNRAKNRRFRQQPKAASRAGSADRRPARRSSSP